MTVTQPSDVPLFPHEEALDVARLALWERQSDACIRARALIVERARADELGVPVDQARVDANYHRVKIHLSALLAALDLELGADEALFGRRRDLPPYAESVVEAKRAYARRLLAELRSSEGE